jgi:hypothetical protein
MTPGKRAERGRTSFAMRRAAEPYPSGQRRCVDRRTLLLQLSPHAVVGPSVGGGRARFSASPRSHPSVSRTFRPRRGDNPFEASGLGPTRCRPCRDRRGHESCSPAGRGSGGSAVMRPSTGRPGVIGSLLSARSWHPLLLASRDGRPRCDANERGQAARQQVGNRGEDGVVDAQDRREPVLMGQVSLTPPASGSAA